MITLTTVITQPNISRWHVIAFEIGSGRVTIRFENPSGVQFIDIACTLSDAANSSIGVALNPTAQHWDDKVVAVGSLAAGVGVGAAGSLTNAQNAYRSAGSNAAGLKAVETQALVDGWVAAALTGT